MDPNWSSGPTSTPKRRVLLPHPCGVVVARAVGSQKVLKKDDDANDHDDPDEDDDEENYFSGPKVSLLCV